jgi:hypothetical protein
MSQGVWKCDSCHANNDTGAATCRLCSRVPGSATGVVAVVTHQKLPAVRPQQPAFVQSRHDRPTVTLAPPAPVRPTPAPPVSRPAPSPRPPTPRRAPAPRAAKPNGCLVTLLLVLGVLAGFLLLALLGYLVRGTGPNSAAVACPAEVVHWLPASATNPKLVARYDAPSHVVTICQDRAGQLYYDGQAKNEPATDQYHILLLADRTATGFEAFNHSYRYEIAGSELIVTNNGAEVARWTLTPVR